MQCPKCNMYINDDMNFCPRCGFPIDREATYHQEPAYKENREEPVFEEEEDIYKGYWKKPILWILSIVLFALAFTTEILIALDPIDSQTQEVYNSIAIDKDNDIYQQGFNNINSGYVNVEDDTLYYAYNNSLYGSNVDYLNASEKILDDCVGYISVDDDCVYYCDSKYNYHCFNVKSKDDKVLLENIYYPILDDDMLYYQKDSDKESIYCFDLEKKTDTKINSDRSYEIQVDDKYIYYLCKKDEDYSIKRINKETLKEETIYNGQVDYCMDDQYIYVSDTKSITRIDKKTKKEKTFKQSNRGVCIVDKQLVCYDMTHFYKVDMDSKKCKEFFESEYIDDVQVAGDCLVYSLNLSYDDQSLMIVNLDGVEMKLKIHVKNIEEFEGLKEV